jgi:O-antigen/teichoic acid export membrane protein
MSDIQQFFRTGIRNSSYTTVGLLSNMLISLLFAGLTIRYLGLERSGFLLALQAVLGINGVVADLGLATPLSRRLALFVFRRRFQYARWLLGTIVVTSSASSILFSIVLVATFPWIFEYSKLDPLFYPDAWWATVFSAAQFVLQQPSNAFRIGYTCCQRYDLYHGTSIVINLGSTLLRLAVLLLCPTMMAVTAAGLAASAGTILLDLALLKNLMNGVPYPALIWREVRMALGFGTWNYLTRLAGFFYLSADRIILTAYLGAGALPFYALPQRFVEQIHSLLSGQLHYLFPYFSSLGDDSRTIIEKVEDPVRWMLAITAVVLYGGLALFGHPLLTILVGAEFADQASIPLALACIQGVFMAQVIFNYYATWSQNEAKVNALYDLTSYGGGCLLALGLIPLFGVEGAALARLVVVPLFFFHLYYSRRYLQLPCNLHAMVSPYALPLALLGFLVVSQWLLSSLIADWRWHAVAASFVLPLGCLAVWRIEVRYFKKNGRAELVTQLVAMVWNWFRGFGVHHPA